MEENVIQINMEITKNVDVSVKNVCEKCLWKNVCEEDYTWNAAKWSCRSEKYLASIMNDSVITCDETDEETKAIPNIFNEKKTTGKTQNFYILLPFFLTCYSIIVSC